MTEISDLFIYFFQIDRNFATSVENRLIALNMNFFMKYSHDPGIVQQIKTNLKDYCLDINTNGSIMEKTVPQIVNILNSPKEKVPSGIQVITMDLLQTIIKYSKLPNEIVTIGFPVVIKSIIKSDDQLLMQAGGECLYWYLLHCTAKVLTFTDGDGKTGLDYILEAINKLLDPVLSENVCKHVGKLIVTLISKAGSSLETRLHILLRAILSKMQRAESVEVWQSLLVVFAYLFYTECDAIVSFLTSIPGPTGVSALQFVLDEWISKETFFFGYYEHTLSTLGFCKLLEYAVTTQDSRFDGIMLENDIVISKNDEKDRTMYTYIPVLVKAFKIILLNWNYLVEESEHSHGVS